MPYIKDPKYAPTPNHVGSDIKCPYCGAENLYMEDIESLKIERLYQTGDFPTHIIEYNRCKKCGREFETAWVVKFWYHCID